MSLVVVPTGTANIASVLAGLRRLGETPTLSTSVESIESADRVVVPGVGSFGAAGAELDRVGLRGSIRARIESGRPTLAICVGMQLLADSSEESEGVEGLGVIGRTVRRFPEQVTVPQLGWNQVEAGLGCRFITDGWAYFANSYRLESVPDGWSTATTDHGGVFVSALERGDVLACQFHPELSGEWGSSVLARWLGKVA